MSTKSWTTEMIKNFRLKIHNFSKKYGQRWSLDLSYFLKNGFWMVLRLAVNTVLALVLYAFFTRLVSPEIFGQYHFILSIFAVVYVFSHPGLNTSLLRSVSRGYDGDYILAVKKSFWSSLLGVPILLVLGAFYYFTGQTVLGISLMISSIFFPFFYAPNTWEWFLQGKHRFDVLARYSTIQSFFNTLATISIIFLKKGNLVWIVAVYLISYTFFNGFYYFKSLKYRENKKSDSDFLEYGRFLTKINIWVVLAGNVDKILIGILLGPADLAVYTVATFLVVRIQSSLKTLTALFFPKMASLKIGLAELLRRQKNRVIWINAGLLFCAAVYYLTIPIINELLFTRQYAQFSHISQIFTITFFLSVPIGILGYYINARKNEFAIMLTNPVFNILRILLNIYFIWNYKLLGAAIAFNLSMIIWVGLHLYGIFHEEDRISDIGK